MRLNGAAAIVTGGGRGIGRRICLAFAVEGARVVVAAPTHAEIDAAVQEIESVGATRLAVPVDVADEQSVSSLVTRTLAEYGRVDILVNNAAISHRRGPVAEMDSLTWDSVLAVNLRGVFLCSLGAWQRPYINSA